MSLLDAAKMAVDALERQGQGKVNFVVALKQAVKESEDELKPARLPRGGRLKDLKVDLHDKSKHGWSGPIGSCGLWTMGYHIPSKRTGFVVVLRVYGETKVQCLERKKRIDKALKGVLSEEVRQ